MSERVFGTLAFHGRLPIPSLKYHTQLSPIEIRHSLSVLIQQHLVLWYDAGDSGQALYEADVSSSYALARSGKYIQLVKERLGDTASSIISNVIVLGHVSVGDLIRHYFPPLDGHQPFNEVIPKDYHCRSIDHQSAKPNGATHEDAYTTDTFHSSISDLLETGFLCPLHESHFRPAADNVTEAERTVHRETHYKSKREEQAAWELAVEKKLEEWKHGSKEDIGVTTQTQKGTKRASVDSDDDQPSAKKRKLMNARANGINDARNDLRSTSADRFDVRQILLKYDELELTYLRTILFYESIMKNLL
ncbi:MAG: hypothetical protein Q9170_004545 [Blastenia crenularia]